MEKIALLCLIMGTILLLAEVLPLLRRGDNAIREL